MSEEFQTSGVYPTVTHATHDQPQSARPPTTRGAAPQAVRREVVDRDKVIRLMQEKRYEDVVILLKAARRRRPYDLEILRSLRILELHLAERVAKRSASAG